MSILRLVDVPGKSLEEKSFSKEKICLKKRQSK